MVYDDNFNLSFMKAMMLYRVKAQPHVFVAYLLTCILSSYIIIPSLLDMPSLWTDIKMFTIQIKIMKFRWRARPLKVSRDVMFQVREKGGIITPNIETFKKSRSWFGRLLNNGNFNSCRVL